MRYTYELYNEKGRRVEITTRLSELAFANRELAKGWRVEVTDNMSNKMVHTIYSLDDMEDWIECLQRNHQWADAGQKKFVQERLRLNGFCADRNCVDRDHMEGHLDKCSKASFCREHKNWDPFNENETGIHMKSTPAKEICFRSTNMGRWEIHTGKNHNEDFAAESFKPLAGKSIQSLTDNNAKTAAAVGKPTFSAVPPIAWMALGAAMQDGATKYGRFNWRDTQVSATVFYDAMRRHLEAWFSGERNADDSTIHHLAHLMAGCAIVLDAEHNGVFNDDRKAGKTVTNKDFPFVKANAAK